VLTKLPTLSPLGPAQINKQPAQEVQTWADAIEYVIQAKESLEIIYNTLNEVGICMALEPHQENEPDVVALLLGVEALGINKLSNAIKSGFMIIRNFFLKLKNAVVSFFKYLFDANSKTRRLLSKLMNEYNKNAGRKGLSSYPVVSMMPYDAFMNTVQLMSNLYDEVNRVYKANNKESIPNNATALNAFGYKVEDYRVTNADNQTEIPKVSKALGSTDSNWGWNMQSLTQATNEMLVMCTKAEKLNYIKDKLDNNCKSVTYAIDRLSSVGKDQAAIKLHEQLSELALISGYMFNCCAVFQKKVDYLASQLIESWYTLNSVSAK
jgi:hypothetical protein